MSYTIQAFIGDVRLIDGNLIGGATVLPLYGSLVIVPLVKEVTMHMGIQSLPLTDEDFDAVPAICEVGGKLSKSGRVAYIEAEFFGGAGAQANCLFENGILVSRPTVHENAINEALKFLRVEIAGAFDEFETVGLGRHRSTERWLGED